MKQAAAHTTTSTDGGKAPVTAGLIALTFIDTTWRIAVPVLLFAAAGIFLDKKFDTAPGLTLLGVAAGFIVAALLVKKQLHAVEAQEERRHKESA